MAVKREAEQELEGCGRVLLRYSGTENLCRIMVEGRNDDLVKRWLQRLAEAADRDLR